MPLAPERAAEIEEELAHHMEAFYATLLGRGIDSGRAAAMVRAEVPRWRKLAHDLGRAERPVASSLLGVCAYRRSTIIFSGKAGGWCLVNSGSTCDTLSALFYGSDPLRP